MEINVDSLPLDTRAMFEYLSSSEAMKATGATLMGGTALTLLIGHRLSEDLDFFCFQDKLPVEVNSLIMLLKKTHSVHSTLTPSQISQARINGYNIEDYIREYLIDGVKVSFGVINKGGVSRSHYFKNATVIDYQAAFNILDLDSLFKSKSVVLSDRIKSRDLFDLMVLIRDHGYTVKDMVDAIIMVDDKDEQQAHAVLEILIGNVPLDSNDPGFNSIKLNVSIDEIYNFFKEEVNKYEQMLVKAAYDL
jgi:hypothetical protein